jgi:chaperonin GroES
MTLTPLQDRILIRRIAEKNKTSGGILIPDTAQEKAQEGEVIAVGKGKRLDNGTVQPIDVKPGDRILFGKYTGSDIKLDGVEHLILREEEVLGVLEQTK